MKLAERKTRRHQNAPPHHRADPGQPEFDLEDRVGVRREVLCRNEKVGRCFMPPDYCLSASPSPDTPEILMLSNHLRPAPGARREYPSTGQRPERLQQARPDVRCSGRGAQAIPKRRRAKGTVQHVHVAEGGQRSSGTSTPLPGVGAKKTGGSTPCTGYAPGVEMPRQIEKKRLTVPSAGGSGS